MAWIDGVVAVVAEPHAQPLVAWWASVCGWGGQRQGGWLLVLALSLVGYAVWPRLSRWRRWITQWMAALLLLGCLYDAAQVLGLHAAAVVPNKHVVPLSLVLAAASGWMLWAISHAPEAESLQKGAWWRRFLPVCLGAVVCAQLFIFGQMVFLGNSDYRRNADAVVVFGARVYRNGRPSLALADRVRTAASLVRDGYAPKLIVSGGPGDGSTHEAEAMRDLAVAEGVPVNAIQLDRMGVNTRATVDNSLQMLDPGSRVLAVSHGYHLPRIKLCYQQRGVTAYTVPAKETRTLLRLPWYMLRESMGFWAHAFGVG